jgi:hypothetical protein
MIRRQRRLSGRRFGRDVSVRANVALLGVMPVRVKRGVGIQDVLLVLGFVVASWLRFKKSKSCAPFKIIQALRLFFGRKMNGF